MLSGPCARLIAGGRARCCCTLAATALVVLVAAAVQGRGASAATWPSTALGSHAMVYLNAPYSFKEAMFRESARLGASWIRVDLALTAVFDAPGGEDWRQVDEVLALAQRYALHPVGVVLATPWFLAACPAGASADSYKCPPSDLDAWKRMVSKLAAHTRGVIDTFEILNEPDGRWAFAGSATDYAKLLRAGHDAIKAGNPRAKVAIAGTMSLASRAWLEQVFAYAGPHPERLYDIANAHIRGPLRSLPRVVHAWRAFFAAHHAADKPLWVTEFGYPSDPAYQYDPAYRSGPASQAAYLHRALPALLQAGAVKVFVTLRDNLTGQFASEGVIAGAVADPPQPNPQIMRKPAFVAISNVGTPDESDCVAPRPRDVLKTPQPHASWHCGGHVHASSARMLSLAQAGVAELGCRQSLRTTRERLNSPMLATRARARDRAGSASCPSASNSGELNKALHA